MYDVIKAVREYPKAHPNQPWSGASRELATKKNPHLAQPQFAATSTSAAWANGGWKHAAHETNKGMVLTIASKPFPLALLSLEVFLLTENGNTAM